MSERAIRLQIYVPPGMMEWIEKHHIQWFTQYERDRYKKKTRGISPSMKVVKALYEFREILAKHTVLAEENREQGQRILELEAEVRYLQRGNR